MDSSNMALYMSNRRAIRLEIARERLGGRCKVCGTSRDLDFDHVDPTSKLMNVSSAKCLDGPMERLVTEVDKCQLLCKEHHKIKTRENGDPRGGGHNKILDPQHGTSVMYSQKCRCEVCKQWKRDYRAGVVDARGNAC